MPKSSKKRKRNNDPERKAKRIGWQVAQNEIKTSRLDASVTLPETVDGSNYQLVFDKFNHRLSELEFLTTASAESLIKKLSDITRCNSRSIGSSRLIHDKIEYAGEYKKLFTNLSRDVEIIEIKFSGNGGDGRIFCYFVDDHPHENGTANYCVIVAIRCNHTPL